MLVLSVEPSPITLLRLLRPPDLIPPSRRLKVEPRPVGQLAPPLLSNSLRRPLTFRARPPTRRVVAGRLTPPRMPLPSWEAEFGTHA